MSTKAPGSAARERRPGHSTERGAEPLAGLAGALRYAAGNGYANLAAVRDLGSPLRHAVAQARGRLPVALVEALERELPLVDSASPAERRGSVERLVSLVARGGAAGPAERSGQTAPCPPPAAVVAAAPRAAVVAGPAPPALVAAAPPVAVAAGAAPPGAEERGPRVELEKRRPPRSTARAETVGLDTPLRELGRRLWPRLTGALARQGLETVGELLFLPPRAYEDRRSFTPIARLRAGARGTFLAWVRRVEATGARGPRRGPFRAVLGDATGSVAAVYFRGGPWLAARFPLGARLVVSGELRCAPSGWEVHHPEVEPAPDAERASVHFGRVVPVYPGFEPAEQRALRELAALALERLGAQVEDPLPLALRQRQRLLPLHEALRALHFPAAPVLGQDGAASRAPAGQTTSGEPGRRPRAAAGDDELLETLTSAARRRLAFDELFFLQLALARNRWGVSRQAGVAFDTSPEIVAAARALLPFTLTRAQARVVDELLADMAAPRPMCRLVQGDVGSGKTAVALVAAAVAVANRRQVALMAPTELLAEQHAAAFERALRPAGARVALLSGGTPARARAALLASLRDGTVQVVVGTHALLQEPVAFQTLGLVVIDEQHRFGVVQRLALAAKGPRPDTLVMTATPIPRTLAMSLYGDLDVSVIDELPPGRTPVATRVLREAQRAEAAAFLAARVAEGRQAYVVFPLVEESAELDARDATRGAAAWAALLPAARVGLLHGRMRADEKRAAMAAFRARELDVLVATTAIEVGVDVPNATVMLVEQAERFGLSQLHQLRGRVGRGAAASHCLLLAGGGVGAEAARRLRVLEASSDGFVIAEEDLALRGPGELLGTRQSGLAELTFAQLPRDQRLLGAARDEAVAAVAADPRLSSPDGVRLARALAERWEGRLALAQVG